MKLSALILKWMSWRVEVKAPDFDKCIICVAPHTSNWDFFICKLAYRSVGRDAGFLMKKDWFFFPLGCIFRAMGGIPVVRKNKSKSLVDEVVQKFNNSEKLQIAITPEGTRKKVSKWHSGFLRIALDAHVPCILAALDFEKKEVFANEVFWPTGNVEADLKYVKNFYKNFKGKHPHLFSTEDQ